MYPVYTVPMLYLYFLQVLINRYLRKELVAPTDILSNLFVEDLTALFELEKVLPVDEIRPKSVFLGQ